MNNVLRIPSIVIFLKDFRSELRTRYALNALLMFVLTTLSIILFSIGNEPVSVEIHSGILWVVIFFSAMTGLSRAFVSEEERGTSLFLHLVARPIAVFAGKVLFNFILLVVLNSLTVMLYVLLIDTFTVKTYSLFAMTLFLGTSGLAVASTILAAIISKTNVKGALYPVLSFPVLLPVLISSIDATKLAVIGAPISEAVNQLQVLLAYDVAMCAVSYLVFPFIWNE